MRERAVESGFSDEDRRFMRMALRLAERGRGHTRPNPVVGAVVVRDGQVVARGFHRRAGGPHAEVEALAQLDFRADGATLYSTLEPCCHTGRTGPCTLPIIESGVARVVVGCGDLNPLVSGRGIDTLRSAGVRVEVGCLEVESQRQNRAFFRWTRDHRPLITLKVAATLDGFIAPPHHPKRVHWITGPVARAAAHELRAAHDAVLVGAGTVLADNPRLNVRDAPAGSPQPLRVVLDGRLRTPPRARLFRTRTGVAPLVIGRARPRDPALAQRVRGLERAGAEVLLLPGDASRRVPLPAVLAALAARNVQSLLVEGGSRVLGAFIDARAADSVAFFLAPRLAGAGVPIVQGEGLDWKSPIVLGPPTTRVVGGDLLVTADVVPTRTRLRR